MARVEPGTLTHEILCRGISRAALAKHHD